MNDSNMNFDTENSEFQEEWLSALLDDELSPQQREIVEQRLQQDPAMREVLEGLKRVRGLVSDLPGWTGQMKPIQIGAEIEEDAFDDENSGEFRGAGDLDEVEEIIQRDLASKASVTLDGENLSEELSEPENGTGSTAGDHAADAELVDDVEEILANGELESEVQLAKRPRPSMMRWIRPIGIAASLLLMLGIGYALLPGSPGFPIAASLGERDNTNARATPPSPEEGMQVADKFATDDPLELGDSAEVAGSYSVPQTVIPQRMSEINAGAGFQLSEDNLHFDSSPAAGVAAPEESFATETVPAEIPQSGRPNVESLQALGRPSKERTIDEPSIGEVSDGVTGLATNEAVPVQGNVEREQPLNRMAAPEASQKPNPADVALSVPPAAEFGANLADGELMGEALGLQGIESNMELADASGGFGGGSATVAETEQPVVGLKIDADPEASIVARGMVQPPVVENPRQQLDFAMPQALQDSDLNLNWADQLPGEEVRVAFSEEWTEEEVAIALRSKSKAFGRPIAEVALVESTQSVGQLYAYFARPASELETFNGPTAVAKAPPDRLARLFADAIESDSALQVSSNRWYEAGGEQPATTWQMQSSGSRRGRGSANQDGDGLNELGRSAGRRNVIGGEASGQETASGLQAEKRAKDVSDLPSLEQVARSQASAGSEVELGPGNRPQQGASGSEETLSFAEQEPLARSRNDSGVVDEQEALADSTVDKLGENVAAKGLDTREAAPKIGSSLGRQESSAVRGAAPAFQDPSSIAELPPQEGLGFNLQAPKSTPKPDEVAAERGGESSESANERYREQATRPALPELPPAEEADASAQVREDVAQFGGQILKAEQSVEEEAVGQLGIDNTAESRFESLGKAKQKAGATRESESNSEPSSDEVQRANRPAMIVFFTTRKEADRMIRSWQSESLVRRPMWITSSMVSAGDSESQKVILMLRPTDD